MGTTILVAFGRAIGGDALDALDLGPWLFGVEGGAEAPTDLRLFKAASGASSTPAEDTDFVEDHARPGLLAGVVLDRIGPEDEFRDLRDLRTVPTAAEEARAYRAIKSLPPALLHSRALSPLGILFIRTDDEENGS